MSKIVLTDSTTNPATPEAGQTVVFTKSDGVYTRNAAGDVSGPLGGGGGGSPTGAAGGVLTGTYPNPSLVDSGVATAKIADGAVTSSKLGTDSVLEAKISEGAVATAKIAANAVTAAKIADGNVTTVKIADNAVTTGKLLAPGGTGHGILYTEGTGSEWKFGYPEQLRFSSPDRIALLGDAGDSGGDTPLFLRAVNWQSGSATLGYIPRTQVVYLTTLSTPPTIDSLSAGASLFHVNGSAEAWIYLPDSSLYPPGFEIMVWNAEGSDLLIGANGSGVSPMTTPPANRQIINVVGDRSLSELTGRKFVTLGTAASPPQPGGGWLEVGSF